MTRLSELELEHVARRRAPSPSDEERTAIAVAHAYGESQSDLAQHFGYDPRTIRRALRSIPDEERRLIGTVAAQELAGLHTAIARRAIHALLERDLNRVRVDAQGQAIPGAYVVSEAQLGVMAGIATDKLRDLRVTAGLGSPHEGGAPTNPVLGFLQTGEELQRVTRGLPAGAKLKLDLRQSLEVSREDDSDSPSPVDASFSIDDG